MTMKEKQKLQQLFNTKTPRQQSDTFRAHCKLLKHCGVSKRPYVLEEVSWLVYNN